MGLGAIHRSRRLPAFVALMGMVCYTGLFALHTVSQTTIWLAEAALTQHQKPLCHSEAGGETKQQAPTRPQTHCPICTGYAALGFAISSPIALSIAPPTATLLTFAHVQDGVHSSVRLAPLNRGPPTFIA
jgi:Protein of unknown function (DUF2946)